MVSDAAAELLGKIRLGEDSFLEFKDVFLSGGRIKGPGRDQLADELAAFANSTGGVVVLGVSDEPRAVTGIPIEHLDAVERYVSEIASDSITPPLLPLIEKLELPLPMAGCGRWSRFPGGSSCIRVRAGICIASEARSAARGCR